MGGLDVVPTALLEPFDYVALGHLHGKMRCRHQCSIQWLACKIFFIRNDTRKGVWLVETEAEVHFQFRALKPLRDIQQLTGSFQQLTDPAFIKK